MINRELRVFRELKRKYKPLINDAKANMEGPARGIFLNAIAIFFSAGYRAGLRDANHKEPPLKLRPWKPTSPPTTPSGSMTSPPPTER